MLQIISNFEFSIIVKYFHFSFFNLLFLIYVYPTLFTVA
jgi:hypothetical protein